MKKIIFFLAFIIMYEICHAQTRFNNQKNISNGSLNKNVSTVPMQKTPSSHTPSRDKFSKNVKWQNGTYKNTTKLADGSTLNQSYTINPRLETVRTGSPKQNDIKRILKSDNESQPSKVAGGWEQCQTKEVKITASNVTDAYIDNSAQIANILPGYIYKFEDYIKGNWKPISENRYPITLIASVNNTNGTPSVVIENPNNGNIANAKNELFNRFTLDKNKISQEGFDYKYYEVESQSDLAIKMGASGYGWGIKASALMSSKKSNKHRYILIDATKSMFSIKCDPSANGIINPAFATDDMMYINSVSYGARILACAEIESYSAEINSQIDANVDYGVAGGSANLNYFSNYTGSKVTIKYYVVGGPSDQVSTVYSFDELKASSNAVLKNLNYHNVQPIKFQFKNLNNDLVISSSATDYFLTQTCTYDKDPETPKNKMISVSIPNISKVDIQETDLELYGQVWAQVFGSDGKEIFPIGNRDRLFAIDVKQPLNANNLRTGHIPNIEAKFLIPGNVQNGAKVIVYYWFMEYDGGSGDDFLSMQHGYKKRYNKNNIEYYVHEIPINWVSLLSNGDNKENDPTKNANKKSATFVDQDGESAIQVESQVELVK
ncbi:MAG: hypothetical protein IPL09_00930 [Bacteroidetes bacterium]|jgi:hypothetical protein|nr:hypothetical protein [Bacteroidota bacterium]MBK8328050.1 hypothetical protein [Bacteroidota bacterium]MBK9299501.1 hypothetical protein [Bacteroidota bacterium]MBK9483251.1 hypothetical protein [Bacteroidota bacterium]